MAFFTPAAIAAAAAVASAGAGIYSAATANNGAANTGYGLAKDGLQNSLNQQQYERMLNTLALQRSTAGSTDGQGSSVVYDPATNSWRTTLGAGPARVQQSSNDASVARNTTDLNTAETANQSAIMRSLMADRAAGPALAAVKNFHPTSTNELAGALQERSTLANRQTEDPIIADTLRQFARTGTAAGPVLTQMQRDNADTLRKTVMDDTIGAMTQGAGINNANRAGLVGTYQALKGAADPGLNFSPISTQNPSDALAQETASRATGAGAVPTSGLFGTALGTNAVNTATTDAIKAIPNSNLDGIKVGSIGNSLVSAADNYSKILRILNSGRNNTPGTTGIPNDPNQPPTAAYFNGQTQVPYFSANSGDF